MALSAGPYLLGKHASQIRTRTKKLRLEKKQRAMERKEAERFSFAAQQFSEATGVILRRRRKSSLTMDGSKQETLPRGKSYPDQERARVENGPKVRPISFTGASLRTLSRLVEKKYQL